MSKKLGSVEIGGQYFNLLSGYYTPITNYWSIEEAYETPSTDYIGIASRNCFEFTINGRITVNGEKYTYYISKTRNEIFKAR